MTTVEGVRGELSDAAQPVDLSGDQARAERVAAARRHRRQLIDLAIRVASLAIALALWEVAAWNVDPVLFTSPTKVATSHSASAIASDTTRIARSINRRRCLRAAATRSARA